MNDPSVQAALGSSVLGVISRVKMEPVSVFYPYIEIVIEGTDMMFDDSSWIYIPFNENQSFWDFLRILRDALDNKDIDFLAYSSRYAAGFARIYGSAMVIKLNKKQLYDAGFCVDVTEISNLYQITGRRTPGKLLNIVVNRLGPGSKNKTV